MYTCMIFFHILRMYPGFLHYTPNAVMDLANARTVPVFVTSDTEDLVLEQLAQHAAEDSDTPVKKRVKKDTVQKQEESLPEIAPKGTLDKGELRGVTYDSK